MHLERVQPHGLLLMNRNYYNSLFPIMGHESKSIRTTSYIMAPDMIIKYLIKQNRIPNTFKMREHLKNSFCQSLTNSLQGVNISRDQA